MADDIALPKSAEEYRERAKALYELIQSAANFNDVMDDIIPEIRALMGAERVTIYQKGRHDNMIISRFKTGKEILEIRVPLSTTSIAGFVALSQQPLYIADVYDQESLKKIHANLRFDRSFDEKSGYRSRSMVVVPIKCENILLGVMQVLNKANGGAFVENDAKRALHLAQIIGKKFRDDLKGTDTPYEYLTQTFKIASGLLQELLDRARKQNLSATKLLVQEGGVAPEDLGKSLEMYYQVPYQPYQPNMALPDNLIKKIKNVAYLKKLLCIPISGDEDEAVVIIDDPTDYQRIMELQRLIGVKNMVVRVATAEDILSFLGQGQNTGPDMKSIVGQLEDEVSFDDKEETSETMGENDAPVIQLVNKIISEAYRMNASDIHIEPGREKAPTKVRMRIDGVCQEILSVPANYSAPVLSRIKIMSRLDIAERRKPQDGKCKVKIGDRNIELRVATIPTVNGESAVMRVLAAAGALPMEKLNLTPNNLAGVEKLIAHPHGIFLVVGPTGSGKTTTLHAVLGHLNKPDRKIWTAEDPVEITQPGLQQVQVSPKIGFDFAAAMRAFLRADPDIILIGEMRDRETSHIGVEASLTGHLVLSTLHTNSAPETITRLLDLGLDPLNFADAFLGVLAQRLMRTLCANCAEWYKPNPHDVERLIHAYGEAYFPELNINLDELQLKRPVGCERCGGTGYRGRTGIHELLASTPDMANLIAHHGTVNEIRALAIKQGMRTLMQDGAAKVLKGQSDIMQLFRVVAEE